MITDIGPTEFRRYKCITFCKDASIIGLILCGIALCVIIGLSVITWSDMVVYLKQNGIFWMYLRAIIVVSCVIAGIFNKISHAKEIEKLNML